MGVIVILEIGITLWNVYGVGLIYYVIDGYSVMISKIKYVCQDLIYHNKLNIYYIVFNWKYCNIHCVSTQSNNNVVKSIKFW